jgi:peptidoglycan/LPS O-acetylase OafA/YrhL
VARRDEVAWGAIAAGVGSVAALPVAIYLTRFSDAYELLHASVAIPPTALLGAAAVALSARARRRATATLRSSGGPRGATLARVLGIVGLCIAAAALVALGVYGLLEYAGTRE